MVDLTAPAARAQRDTLAARTDVIDKVKVLSMMPDDLHVTRDMVANYFEVDPETIKKLVQRNQDELQANGLRILRGQELRDMMSLSSIDSRASALMVFTRRTVLVTAMLLRDSPVARQLRTHLLDVEERTVAPKAKSEFDILRGMIDQLEESRREAAEAKALAAKSEALSVKTDARLDAIEGRHDWYAALGFARLHKLNTSVQYLSKVGRKATTIAKRNGISPVKVPHQLYGEANSYPAWVWELAFAEVS